MIFSPNSFSFHALSYLLMLYRTHFPLKSTPVSLRHWLTSFQFWPR